MSINKHEFLHTLMQGLIESITKIEYNERRKEGVMGSSAHSKEQTTTKSLRVL